jgi:murein DD-endopeptidase MepM/ murein hydrolase activator NlpD
MVQRGMLIGRAGSTGSSNGISHVHLEVWERQPYLHTGFRLPMERWTRTQ